MPESSPAILIHARFAVQKNSKSLFDVHNAPVHCGMLWKDRQAALDAPEGEISLTLCFACSHVFNRKFDADLMQYEQPYDNSLFFSPRFQEYACYQANRLIETYKITKKNIIEVGSGKGDFLKLICELGDNHGIGFDPSYTPAPGAENTPDRVEFIADYYTERYVGFPADLIYSRHTLEHVEQPVEFLSSLRKTADAQNQTLFFMEVPNVDFAQERNPTLGNPLRALLIF